MKEEHPQFLARAIRGGRGGGGEDGDEFDWNRAESTAGWGIGIGADVAVSSVDICWSGPWPWSSLVGLGWAFSWKNER